MPTTAPAIHTLDWRLSPHDVFVRWQPQSLACLISGSPNERWSIFAAPTQVLRADANGRVSWHGADPLPITPKALSATHPLEALNQFFHAQRLWIDSELPFLGGWIGGITYDLGRFIEPKARHPHRAHDPPSNDPPPPVMEFCRCDEALIYDAHSNQWWAVGRNPLALASAALHDGPVWNHDRLSVKPPVSTTGRDRFIRDVARCVELIRNGDAFQVNLSHQLVTPFSGATRTLMARMLAAAAPGYGAYIESHDPQPVAELTDEETLLRAYCSISPELFLDVDFNTRRVTTRPIKGTRPATDADRADLERSEKDRAELAMIVDLMRNDLGRVCEYSSVNVDLPRTIARIGPVNAGALYHASSTISGQLRPDISLADLLRATFPPGSVTGAPKVRAMQIIDELEPHRRGMYCGTLGFISDHGRAVFNVAIRTATFDGAGPFYSGQGTLTFPVGAGIVEGSDPESEWNETMHKAQMFLNSLNPSPAPRERTDQRTSVGQVRASKVAR